MTIRGGLSLSLAAALLLGPSSAAQEDRFEEATSVVAVEVPVRVVKNGRPVRGLAAADFVLYDRGRRVEDFSFEVLDFSPRGEAPGEPQAEAAVPFARQSRNFLFVYDFALNSNRRMLGRASATLREALGERLGPGDRVAIALFRGQPTLQYVLDFTSEPGEVREALAVVDAILAGDFWDARDRLARLREVGAPAPESRRFGRAWGSTPMLPARARRMTGLEPLPADPLTAETLALFDYRFVLERGLVMSFLRALVEVGEATGDLSGQKHLILLSTGYPDYLLFGNKDTVGTLTAMRRVFRSFREANWTLHGVDAALGFGSTSLFYLAHETGGEVFVNSNDPGILLEDLFERTEVVYLLSFQPQDLERDGRFHALRVELVGGPRGARALHRPAYRAPAPVP